jgi:RecA/RadA recombinase
LQRIIPSGCGRLDEQLGGGLAEGTVTLVYGAPETGKSTLALQCAVNCARMDYKTLFIDCDHTFSATRLTQIAPDDAASLGSQIILIQPDDFTQQSAVLDTLEGYISETVALIVIDSITGLYSAELGADAKATFTRNRELNRQLAGLAQITKTRRLASVVVSQVRSLVVAGQPTVRPVAMRVLRFWADTTLVFKPTAHPQVVKAMVDGRQADLPTKPIYVAIGERGLHDYRGTA